MKTLKPLILCTSCFLGLFIGAAAQSSDPTAKAPADAPGKAPPPAAEQPVPTATPSAPAAGDNAAAAKADSAQSIPAITAEKAAADPDAAEPAQTRPKRPAASLANSKELRLNFRNAPLDSVLNYLSEAAGFIIVPRTGSELRGKVTMWSNQPVSKEEALDLLSSALDQNGYAYVRNGRTLTIYNKEDAKKQDIPVKSGNKPEEIPRNEEMVTQIIPVRFVSAVQVSRDLQPLLPDKATMTANEGGNSLIITDTQISIHRMAEIIKALDTAISSVSAVKVFPLKYADAKALATVLKDLFAPADTARTGNNQAGQNRVLNQFRGGGPGGAFGPGAFGGGRGGGAGGGGGDSSGGRAPTPRVVAVAEERSNSLVVSAPDEQMPMIEELIRQVDTSVEDITELRVFKLRFADAQETADLLTTLFSDSTSSNNQSRGGQIQFGGRFGGPFGAGFGGGNRGGANASADSSRLQKQSKVVAVPDLRTSSVVVSASRDLMVQIGEMIKDLDADPAKKQQVFVFDVQNTDPQQVQDILQNLFPAPMTQNYNNSRNTRQQNGAGGQLNSRATQLQNQGFNRGGNTGGFGGAGGNMSTGRTFGQ